MSEKSTNGRSHIDSIVRQEEQELEQRSVAERFADAVGIFAGSPFFIVLHLALVTAWLLINSGKIPWIRPFDPYPFSLFAMIVAVEAVFLSSFILMRQNRMMRRGERRNHLNLQIDLLAEKEITKLIQMTRAICGKMGLENIMADKEIRELSENTSIESLSHHLLMPLAGVVIVLLSLEKQRSGATQRLRREEHAAPLEGIPAVTLLGGLIRPESFPSGEVMAAV